MATATVEFTIVNNGTIVNNVTIDGNNSSIDDSEVNIVKYNATVEINGVTNTSYFAGSTIHINATTNSTGKINITVNGKSYYVDNNTNIDSTLFEAGHYIVSATVYENHNYTMATDTVEFTIEKFSSPMSVVYNEVSAGEIAEITVILPVNATGNITVSLDDIINITVETIKGSSSSLVYLNELSVGNHTVRFTYGGDENYSSNSTVIILDVSKFNLNLTVDFNQDEGYISVTAKRGNETIAIEGDLLLSIDDQIKPFVENICYIKDLKSGIYAYSVSYAGSDQFNPVTKKGSLTVPKSTTQMEIVAGNVRYGDAQKISVNVPIDATGKVIFLLYYKNKAIANYSSGINKGVAEFTPSNLKVGTYDVNVSLSDSRYYETHQSMKFTVMPKVTIPPVVTITNEGNITVELSNASGRVKLKIDYYEYSIQKIQQNKVVFTVDTDEFTIGNHTVTFQYTDGTSFDEDVFSYWDEKTCQYLPIEYTLEILPKPVIPEAKSDNSDFFEVCILNETGGVAYDAEGTIEFFINGVSVAVVEIVDGIAKLDISQFKDGNYIISWVYSGDWQYNQTSSQSVLNINHSSAKIIAGDSTILYSSGGSYSVVVYEFDGKAANGIKVVFLINNGMYGSAITNSNGVASILITKAPGTYQITATALNTGITKKLTVTHLLNLAKVKVKRSAKKLVIKVSLKKLNGKYLKGKKITLKFNGKKYTAKTNKKGVAKITVKSKMLKKLKKGKKVKYEATYLKDTVKKTVNVK